MSSEWFIMRVDPHEGYLEWPQHELPISPEQAALGALSQEEMDAVVCLRAGLDYLRRPFLEDTVEGCGGWSAESLSSGQRGRGDTRAEALRKLAKQVDPQAGEAPV